MKKALDKILFSGENMELNNGIPIFAILLP